MIGGIVNGSARFGIQGGVGQPPCAKSVRKLTAYPSILPIDIVNSNRRSTFSYPNGHGELSFSFQLSFSLQLLSAQSKSIFGKLAGFAAARGCWNRACVVVPLVISHDKLVVTN